MVNQREIHWDPSAGVYEAFLTEKGERVWVGAFDTREEASKRLDRWEALGKMSIPLAMR